MSEIQALTIAAQQIQADIDTIAWCAVVSTFALVLRLVASAVIGFLAAWRSAER